MAASSRSYLGPRPPLEIKVLRQESGIAIGFPLSTQLGMNQPEVTRHVPERCRGHGSISLKEA
jgi:hypothetical protein